MLATDKSKHHWFDPLFFLMTCFNIQVWRRWENVIQGHTTNICVCGHRWQETLHSHLQIGATFPSGIFNSHALRTEGMWEKGSTWFQVFWGLVNSTGCLFLPPPQERPYFLTWLTYHTFNRFLNTVIFMSVIITYRDIAAPCLCSRLLDVAKVYHLWYTTVAFKASCLYWINNTAW